MASAEAEKASLAWKHTIWPPQRFLEVPRPRIIILATMVLSYTIYNESRFAGMFPSYNLIATQISLE